MTEIQTQAICDLLLNESVKAWNMIKFNRARIERMSETTITEQLVYNIESDITANNHPIRLFQSRKENVNGNDMEIFVNTGDGFLLLPCQAKITNKEYRYEHFWHTVNASRQISLLCDYAKDLGGIPAYLFYNYIPREAQNEAFKKIVHQERYGITFTEANPFLNILEERRLSGNPLNAPTFNSLHPHPAKPLHVQVCDMINGLMNMNSFSLNYDLTYYNIRDITQNRNWEHSRRGTIGFIQSGDWKKKAGRAAENSNNDAFRPKYRLILGDETADNERRIYQIS
ncbi:hypothetical protein SNE25_11905 [Mucilaginibacter sabulilitoris]|uniref:Restriction endonuclease n=1 Tax=Mucilaginibacter sabulilitoris TaxID=1173583 RepID=A0ABZ0TTI4_9SPHI|nr:hypothetical protein [Mucilaginibacter sabulilitoris]WPU96222.1 hypothetical protein SNE25_11905 [Mucilaginibacter sabulilitoris]